VELPGGKGLPELVDTGKKKQKLPLQDGELPYSSKVQWPSPRPEIKETNRGGELLITKLRTDKQPTEGKDMKKIHNMTPTIALCTIVVLSAFAARADEDLKAESKQAITNFKNADSTLASYMNNAVGYAVFPSVGKGGFIVGGARGKGVVFDKNGNVIGQSTMTQGSIGAQAGGQTFAQLILFQTQAALDNFKTGKFSIGADVSAVVAAEGASKTARFSQGVAVFTLPTKGLMVQAAVGGQKFSFQPEAMQPTGRTEPK
jgi:lipid-binding SYLF domain-containing protein